MVVVFPVPGPPVSTIIPFLAASMTAFCCISIQLHPCIFFNFMNAVEKDYICNFIPCIQIMQHLCCIQFHIIIMRSIDSVFFYNDFLFHRKIHQIWLQICNSYAKQFARVIQQFLLMQVNMSFHDTFLQSIKNTAADPEIGICMDSNF